MFKILRKTFVTIEYTLFKELFGFTEANAAKYPESAIQAFISKRGLSIEGSYVHIPNKIRHIDDAQGAKVFHLSQERVQELAKVVQFLEQKNIKTE